MTTNGQDHYAVLGVAPTATATEISHAYRSLLRQLHPDTRAPIDGPQSQDVDRALRQVLAAYGVLGDPARRAAYDDTVAPVAPPPSLRRPQPKDPPGSYRRPPILAGPVRWHPASNAPGRQRGRPAGDP